MREHYKLGASFASAEDFINTTKESFISTANDIEETLSVEKFGEVLQELKELVNNADFD
jgi:hypothetical protein